MPDTIEAPQVQTAADQTRDEILDRIAEAETNNAPTEELLKSLAATRTPVPVPAVAVETPAPVKADTTETETAADTEEIEIETETEQPAGDTPQDEPEGKLPDRFRITHMSDKDRATASAINLLTRTGMDLAEATHRVMGDFGQAIPGTEPVVEAVAPAVAAIQATISAAKTRLGEIKAERSTLAENADLYGPDAVKLDNEQTDILSALAEATGRLTQANMTALQERAQNQKLDDDKQALLGEVAAKWPDAVKPGTLHYMVARQVASDVRGDSSHKDHALSRKAEFVQYCAKEADRLIEEAKKTTPSPNAATAVKSPATTPKAETKQPGPASGSRASAPAAPPKTAKDLIAELDAQIEGGISPAGRRTISPSGQYIG